MNKFLPFLLAITYIFSAVAGDIPGRQETTKNPKEVLNELKQLVKINNARFADYARNMEAYKKAVDDVKKYGLAMQKVKIEIMANKALAEELVESLKTEHFNDYSILSEAYALLSDHKYADYEASLKYAYASDFLTMCHYMKPMRGYFPDPTSMHVRNFFDLPGVARERLAEAEARG